MGFCLYGKFSQFTDVFRRGSTAAANDIHKLVVEEIADFMSHLIRCFIVFAKLVR